MWWFVLGVYLGSPHIIALKSELDSALRVLNYRLSLTTDNVACTIYNYQISLLQHKIGKTHKKLATSVSSLFLFPLTSMHL